MTKLVVELPDGTRVATVTRQPRYRSRYNIDTEDERIRDVIEQVIEQGRQKGLAHRFYRRQKTDKGHVYQQMGRWLKPGDRDFLQALGDYLANYELFAYPEEDLSATMHSP